MKIRLEFDVEIEGELDESKAKEIFFKNLSLSEHILLSENIDETEDWAIILNSYELIEDTDKEKK